MRFALLLLLTGCVPTPPTPDPCAFQLDAYCTHDPVAGGPTGAGCEPLVFPATTQPNKRRARCADGRLRLSDVDVEDRQEDLFSAEGEHQATRFYGEDDTLCSNGLVTYGTFQSCLEPCALDPGAEGIPACE